MSKAIKFGEDVAGYEIPVLNEREIRAASGILFVVMFIGILAAIMKSDFTLLKYSISIFLADISVRVLISPRFSPFLVIGRLIVRNQTPEYVAAQPKKFAWVIGLVLAGTMFTLQVAMNTYSPITGIICLICLIFLFFETAFGICLGCKSYSLIYKEKAKYCPGEVCDVKDKQDIQRTSKSQLITIAVLVAYVVVVAYFFNGNFSDPPHDLFGGSSAS